MLEKSIYLLFKNHEIPSNFPGELHMFSLKSSKFSGWTSDFSTILHLNHLKSKFSSWLHPFFPIFPRVCPFFRRHRSAGVSRWSRWRHRCGLDGTLGGVRSARLGAVGFALAAAAAAVSGTSDHPTGRSTCAWTGGGMGMETRSIYREF